jgi:hypothetical protein
LRGAAIGTLIASRVLKPYRLETVDMHKWIWMSAGVILGALGLVGLILPIIPGVLLLAGSAACFARAQQL